MITIGNTPPEQSTVQGTVPAKLLLRAMRGDASADAALTRITERYQLN
jgi:hypothetical protein